MRYLFSYPNSYLYQDVLYFTLDSFFENHLNTKPALVFQQDEVSRYLWLDMSTVNANELAFASGQNALRAYLRGNNYDARGGLIKK